MLKPVTNPELRNNTSKLKSQTSVVKPDSFPNFYVNNQLVVNGKQTRYVDNEETKQSSSAAANHFSAKKIEYEGELDKS